MDLYAFICRRIKLDKGLHKNPHVSQDIDIVYLPKCFIPFFQETESDLE